MSARILDPKWRYHGAATHATARGLRDRLARVRRELQAAADAEHERQVKALEARPREILAERAAAVPQLVTLARRARR